MTTETHGMKFVVDTTGVAKGFRDYQSAVEGIFSSLDKFEAHVNKTMKGVASAANNKAALSSFKSAVNAFSKVDIDTGAAKKLSALSAAMNGFKAPNATQAQNTKKFFNALSGLPDLGRAYASIKAIDDLNIAMRGFKAPSASQAKNLTTFANAVAAAAPKLNALGGLSGIASGAAAINAVAQVMGRMKVPTSSQITNLGNFGLAMKALNFGHLTNTAGLFATLASISNFKAPGAAQIRNLEKFITAVGNIKVPPNANQLSAALANIAYSANKANASLGGFRTSFGSSGSGFTGFTHGVRGARLEMMGLQNAFSATFQVGSLLRSLLGSLTIGEIGRSFFEAAQAENQFHASMMVVTDDLNKQGEMWTRVKKLADDYGAPLDDLARNFGKFAIAAKEAGTNVDDAFGIYKGFQTAMTALHFDKSQMNDTALALEQIFSKGYVASEEFNKQLNNFPGRMAILDKAVREASHGKLTVFDALKDKMLDAKTTLQLLSYEFQKRYGPAVDQALKSPNAQFTILKNHLQEFMQEIADAGAREGFAKLLAKISSYLNPADMKRYADVIAGKLVKALDAAGRAIDWLYENWDKIKGPLATTLSLLGKWMVVSGALKITSAITTPLIGMGGALIRTAPLMWDMVKATRALAATNLTGYLGMLSKIKSPAIANATAGIAAGMGGTGAGATGAIGTILNGASKVPGVMATATKAVGGFAAAIAGGLAAAWGIAGQAADDAAGGAVSVNYSATEIIMGMWYSAGDWLSNLWTTVTTWIGKKWDEAMTFVTGLGGWMKEQLGFNFSDIGEIAAKTGFVIYYGFSKAFEGVIKLAYSFGSIIGRTIGGVAGALGKLFTGDVAGAGAAAKNVLTGGTIKDGWNDGIGSMSFSPDDMRASYAAVGRGRNGVASFLNDMGAKGRGAQGKPKPKPSIASGQPGLGPPPDLSNLLNGPGNGKGKHKKGRKGKDLEHQEDTVENAVDSLMKKLSADDPIGKLYTDFVKNLTDEAHVLLNNKGYQQFLQNIAKDAKDGKVTVDSLISALENGANLDAKTMADLKKRYGEDVKDIIQLLKNQQADYEQSVIDATSKQIKKNFAAVDKAMEVFSDSTPQIKQMKELYDGLQKIAEVTLSPEAFKDYMTRLRDGSMSSSDAVNELAGDMSDTSVLGKRFITFLQSTGMSADQAADAVRRLGAANAYQRMQSEEEMKFGAKLLRTRQEEIMYNSMSARDAEIMKALQQEVNDKKLAGIPITAEMIKQLRQQLTAQQDLADQVQRNKDFFENNGIRSYINDVKNAGEAANELDKNVLQSLEDQLYSLGTTGKFSFNAIFDTIQQGIVRFAAQNVTKTLVSSLFPKDQLNGGNPTMMGGLFQKLGLGKYEPKQQGALGSSMSNALWVQWAGQAGLDTAGGGVRIDPKTGYPTTGKIVDPQVYLDSSGLDDNGNPTGPTNLLSGIPGYSSPSGADAATVAGANGGAVDKVVSATTTSFGKNFTSTMQSALPLIGMAFASTFKSPIAQIGAMFLSMMLSKMLAGQAAGGLGGGGGGGGIGGLLSGLFGGGGGGGDGVSQALPALFGGIYREGTANTSGNPVAGGSFSAATWAGAPHYAEGTHNTSGGMPAILHPDEAVIPLSRGRKVPVEVRGGAGNGGVNQTIIINTPDADSFRKSKQQVAVNMHMTAARAYRRNH